MSGLHFLTKIKVKSSLKISIKTGTAPYTASRKLSRSNPKRGLGGLLHRKFEKVSSPANSGQSKNFHDVHDREIVS